jgi:hypothetical protein
MNSIFLKITVILFFAIIPAGSAQEGQPGTKLEPKAKEVNLVNLKKLGYLTARRSEKIFGSPWGIEFNAIPPHVNHPISEIDMASLGPEIDRRLEKAAELGVKWARVSVSWTSVEDDNGRFRWDFLDQVISGLKERGIQPYICINGGHPVHTEKLPPTVSEKGLKAWLRMTETLVQRYKEEVSYWEIWNEPNYSGFWKPEPDPAAYVKLVQEGSRLIKAIQPDATVIGGSLARLDAVFAKDLFDLGIAKDIDVLSYHPYDEIPESTAKKRAVSVITPEWYLPSSHQVQRLQEIVAESDEDIKIWQGECGYGSAAHTQGWQGNGPWGENIQAKWLLRRALTDLGSGMEVSAYFILHEYEMGSGVNYKGLLELESGKEKPAFTAYQSLTSLVDNTFDLKPNTSGIFSINDQGIFYGIKAEDIQTMSLRKNEGQDIFLYWLPWRAQELVEPAMVNLSLQGLDIQDPVLVNLLTGEVYEPSSKETNSGGLKLEELPVFDFPVAIVSENSIHISE